MQPHFFFNALLRLWLELKCYQLPSIKKNLFKSTIVLNPCYKKKQLWLEMDFDIILNKPDLNT